MRTCPSCKAENPDGTSFCGQCGASLDGVEGMVSKGMHQAIAGMDSMSGVVSHFVDSILKSARENLIRPYLDHKIKVVVSMMLVLSLLIIVSSLLVFYDVIGSEAYLLLIGVLLGYLLAVMGRVFSVGN